MKFQVQLKSESQGRNTEYELRFGLLDWPANQDIEQHSEENDGDRWGDGDQDDLTALAGDGEGCWNAKNNR